MEQRSLGKTGIKISRMGIGGLFVSSFGSSSDTGCAAIKRALSLGINYIDTAPNYADSEEVLGNAISDVKQKLVISTKLGSQQQPFQPQNRDHIVKSFENSLRMLKRDVIDILFIHEPDRPEMYDWWTDKENYKGPVLDFMLELKSRGLVRAIGVAGTTPYELANIMRTGHFDVVLTAFNYSLLFREAEYEIIPVAKELGIGIVAGSPLQQGDLVKRFDDFLREKPRWMSTPRYNQFKALYKFSDEAGLSIPDMALRFVISNPQIDCILTGARNVQEVEQSVAAVTQGPLSKDVLTRLNEIAAMVPFRPTQEPFSLPFPHKYEKR